MDDIRPPASPKPTTNEARQAVPLHAMRHVLWISLLLVVLAFIIAYAVIQG